MWSSFSSIDILGSYIVGWQIDPVVLYCWVGSGHKYGLNIESVEIGWKLFRSSCKPSVDGMFEVCDDGGWLVVVMMKEWDFDELKSCPVVVVEKMKYI